MSVQPTYYFGESADVVINATSTGGISNFQNISFYVNDELLESYDDVETIPQIETTITGRAEIKCTATIMGEEYTETQIVDRATAFYIGGGNSPSDIIDSEHRKDIDGGMSGFYDVELAREDHLMIVMDSSYESEFERADMNGFDIPFIVGHITIDDIAYTVFRTANTYEEGTYRIYINR